MLDPEVDTLRMRLRVPPSEIVFVNSVLEDYEGLCLPTSIESEPDFLLLQLSPGHLELLGDVIAGLELAEGSLELFPD